MIPKAGVYRSEAMRRAVASLPCVLCGMEGQTQAAHRNQGKGMGMKTDDICAALCVRCHAEIDQGKTMDRAERRATLDAAIVETMMALARAGRIEVR